MLWYNTYVYQYNTYPYQYNTYAYQYNQLSSTFKNLTHCTISLFEVYLGYGIQTDIKWI